jgi:HK97 family phage major capsid protein
MEVIEMVTLKEAMEEHFVSKEDMVELQKAMTTDSASAGDIIEPEIDPRLQNMVVQKYPFYTWLKSVGAISDTRSNKPSYLKKVSGAASDFIGEADDLPATTDSVYDLITGTMTTWVCKLELSDQLIMGSQDSIVDVLDQEIQDALELNIADINAGILTGDGSSDGITGLQSLITTNTDNLSGAEITSKFILDDMCETIMDAGGNPSAIVTSPNVRAQLEEILYPNINIPLLPKQELAFGYQVVTYDSPAGTLPIITDPAMPTTSNQQRLFFVDYSTMMLKYLMNPRVIDLAKSKLTASSVLASFQSFMCRAENFNGQIYNIGTKTS